MSITFRLLQPEDQGILSRAAPGVFDSRIDDDATRVFFSDSRHHLAAAIDEDVVVGFASAVHYVHPDKPHPEMWVNEVGVAPTHRGRGVAKSLLHCLLLAARDLGCVEAWVLTDRMNAAAMRLYASAGGSEAPRDQVMFTFPLQ